MKRLQLRHHDELFDSRSLALEFFTNILNPNRVENTKFGTSLYAEPMVTKYLDDNGKIQILFAIGTDTPDAPYHIIDSADILEKILINKTNLEAEINRAVTSESILQNKIEEEKLRAIENENFISKNIEDGIATIISVEPSSENIREEYVLQNAKGDELGSHIRIYKDNTFVGAEVTYKGVISVSQKSDGSFEFSYDENIDKSVEYLYLIYRNETGTLSFTALDFENFLMESEEGLGINIVNHKITIKIKPNEKYLFVNEDGLQTLNIDDAIIENVNIEKNRAEREEQILQENINKESIRAIEKETLLQSNIDFEKERAINAENNLQLDITNVKKNVDAFLSSADIGEAAIDTLREIQNYINTDGAAAAKMTEDIATNKLAIETEKERAQNTEKEIINNSKIYTDSKFVDLNSILTTSIDNVTTILNESIKTESNRAITVENDLDNRINEEIINRNNGISRIETLLNQEKLERVNSENTLREEIEEAKIESVNESKVEAKTVAIEEVAKIIDGADSSFDTLKEIADWIVNDTTGSAQMANDIQKLKSDFELLNSDDDKIGSIKHITSDVIDHKLIYSNIPITITPENAKDFSLLRPVLSGDKKYYYVSNKASEMLYIPTSGDPVNLNTYITDLETKVYNLEERVKYIEENGVINGSGGTISPAEIKEIVKEYLTGIENEIKIEPNTDDSKLTIGFADDAIFG